MLKKLKSLFVIEDGTSSVKKEMGEEVVKDAKVVDDGKSAAPIQVQPVADKKVKGAPGQSKEKFLNVLFGAMEKANLEGFDYLEFKQFLKSLDSVPMDEETKFKSAYATAQTMGTNIEVLRESASHYLNVLSTEGKKFDQAVDNQKKNNLTSKQN